MSTEAEHEVSQAHDLPGSGQPAAPERRLDSDDQPASLPAWRPGQAGGLGRRQEPGALEGYLQISLGDDGRTAIRGTRALMDWLLDTLADEGWHVELDDARWCG